MNHELSPGRVGGREEEISHVSDGEVGGGVLQGLEEGGFCGDRVPDKAFVSWHNVRISEQPLRCREGCSHHSGLEGDGPVPLQWDSHGCVTTSNECLQSQATYG